jgi:hypothetical protein
MAQKIVQQMGHTALLAENGKIAVDVLAEEPVDLGSSHGCADADYGQNRSLSTNTTRTWEKQTKSTDCWTYGKLSTFGHANVLGHRYEHLSEQACSTRNPSKND